MTRKKLKLSPLDILHKDGAVKQSTLKRREKHNLPPQSNPAKDMQAICRAVMRYPSEEVIAQLYLIHHKMHEAFLNMDDEGLKWLLGGSSKYSRGGFSAKTSRSFFKEEKSEPICDVNKFKKFLKTDLSRISPQRLITGIETIATAMGYRCIGALMTEPPAEPITEPQKKMLATINTIMASSLVPPIHMTYTNRDHLECTGVSRLDLEGIEDLGGFDIANTVDGDDADISSASDVEEDLPPPRKSKMFLKNLPGGGLSWMAAAKESKIPVVAHVSGTVPLVLSAIVGLCRSDELFSKSLRDKKSTSLKPLAAVLGIAAFQRGSFHTIAETSAGINHFLDHLHHRTPQPMQPMAALANGLVMLEEAASNNLRGRDISLREAIAEVAASFVGIEPSRTNFELVPEEKHPETKETILKNI